jgi:signal transduction histidine kinase/ligand-binding sensor domain-containing protein
MKAVRAISLFSLRVVRTRAAVCLAIVACGSRASALNAALDLNQYAHTSWKIRDGFVAGRISAMAQTHDGYLWLGTESGLFRFDGVRVVPWQPPPGTALPSTFIRSLLCARDGTLWIGTMGGLATWKDNTLTQYPALASVANSALLEDRAGTIWATGQVIPTGRLCAIRGANIQCYGQDGGLGRWASSLYESGEHVWAAAENGLWRWTPGDPKRYPVPDHINGLQSFTEDNTGALLVSTSAGVRRFVDGTITAVPLPSSRPQSTTSLLRDRHGGLWIGTAAGLVHLHEGRTDLFARSDGLSGDFVSRLFEDREGNVWVATHDGLDRFREYAAVTLSVGQGLSGRITPSVLADKNGSVWVNDGESSLLRLNAGHVATVRNVLPERGLGTLFQDASGRICVSTGATVACLDHDRVVSIGGVPGGLVNAMVEDPHGTLWVAHWTLGLFRVSTSHNVQQIPWSTFGHEDSALRLAADPVRGGLWLGFTLGGIAYFDDGRVRLSYAAADGLGKGRVNALRVDQEGTVWAATEGGLSRLKNGRIVTLTSANGLPCDAVDSVLEDEDAAAWLYMACGIVRIARAEIEGWAAIVDHNPDAKPTIGVTVLDSSEGVRSVTNISSFSPHTAKSSDGRLWFATVDGVTVVDPRHLPFNDLPPPVHIEQITADRKTYGVPAAANARVRLPALVRDLHIDFTALSLVAPEKVRFRYQLEGWDRDWQDVGGRRQAFYNNLPPRTYRFRVKASNNSGVWNDFGAAIDLSIAPAYYQTTWFPLLSVGLVVAVIWAVHRLRLRIVETHQREITALNERLMNAQEQERIRIAGELHDGVMQQMLAVTMMLGTAKRRIPADSDAKATLDKIQDKLIQTGTDIRQLSHDLHPPVLQESGLSRALQVYCEQFSASCGIPISCDADEDARDLSRGAALAVFRIVQEALGNAAKHAHAKQITVRLTRSAGVVSLVVADDGVGFDTGRLNTIGGLGLVMMRERASQLNGTFSFETAPQGGTTIRVSIPFR